MVRTLTIVALLALLAGLSVGFFVAEAKGVGASSDAPVDPVLEGKVRMYREYYDLGPAQVEEVRMTLREYDQRLADLLRQLRSQHQEQFKALADEANERIQKVLSNRPR